MSRCMQEDPRRRFVLGFTSENSSMKLWFCDRSQVIVSEPFNFITVSSRALLDVSPSRPLSNSPSKEHAPFVHLILSCLYARPEHLGWDPTMIPLSDGRNYDITVLSDDRGPRVYRTLSLLSGSVSNGLRSKGTRVWKVVLLEGGRPTGALIALKDV